MSDRLLHVDGLRGIAALMVTWFHLTNSWPADSWVRASGSFGWLGVEIFFVISGFVIPYSMHKAGYDGSYQAFKIFMLKRLIRIEPPYLISAALCLGLWHLSTLVPSFKGTQLPPPLSDPSIWAHIGYLNGFLGLPWLNVVFWTLAIEFQFYLLCALGWAFVSRSDLKGFAFLSILTLLGVWSGQSEWLFAWLPLFGMGIAVYWFKTGQGKKIAGLAFAISGITAFYSLGVDKATAGLIAALLLVSDWTLLKVRQLQWLGLLSFSLYLVHVPIGGRVVNMGARLGSTEPLHLSISIAALAIVLFCSWCFCKYVEIPAINLQKKFSYKRT